MQQRKLYRSRTDTRIAGVCGGLGDYLGLDSTVIRLAFVLLALTGGHGLLLYLIMWLVMPLNPAPSAVEQPPAPAANQNP